MGIHAVSGNLCRVPTLCGRGGMAMLHHSINGKPIESQREQSLPSMLFWQRQPIIYCNPRRMGINPSIPGSADRA